jgi:hypothetical protein
MTEFYHLCLNCRGTGWVKRHPELQFNTEEMPCPTCRACGHLAVQEQAETKPSAK